MKSTHTMQFFVLLYFLLKISTVSSQGNSYDTSCTCTQVSTSGSVCMSWTCTTNQVTKCFPNDATVEMKNIKQRRLMRDLKIGDEILVDINHQGERVYEPVYAFIHGSVNGSYDYLQIIVEKNPKRSLIVSSSHLIYRFNQTRPSFAGHLKIGDQLESISDHGIKQAESIRQIRLIRSEGFHAPLTHSGKLVVDGLVVSNYAVVANHRLAHLAIQPYRWWIGLLGSSSYSENIQGYCQILYSLVEQINRWLFSIDLYDGHMTVSSF